MPNDTAMSPQRIKSDANGFGYEQDHYNEQRYKHFMAANHETLESDARHSINHYVNSQYSGYLVGLDHKTKRVYYFVHYVKTDKVAFFDKTICQILLWRKSGSALVPGITNKMVFTYLLKFCPLIISDVQQTPDGETFWRNLLGRAHASGNEYGLVNTFLKKAYLPKKEEEPDAFWQRVNSIAYGPDKEPWDGKTKRLQGFQKSWRFFIRAK